MNLYKPLLFIAFCLVTICSCNDKGKTTQENVSEDFSAKKKLQGIWINADEEDVAFRVKGDTISYPDSTSQPVYFQIVQDTLVLYGANKVKYPIVKQASHLFIFKNQNGDQVKLTLSEDSSDKYLFGEKRPVSLNQNVLIKRDTIVTYTNNKYHCYVQINPTSYKVVKASYNDEGVEVDNVYHDNIIHLSVYNGASELFSRDFRKTDYSKNVPSSFLRQSVLSDMTFDRIDFDGLHYMSVLCIPDSPSSYMVETIISFNGKLKMQIASSY